MYLDSSKPDYVAQDWKTKQDQIWEDVKADNDFGAFYPVALFTESVKTTFDCEWDVFPAGRLKAIHGIGAICPFKVNIESSPFTGLYKGGEVHGLIRMGAGIDFTDPLSSGFLPGAAVKFYGQEDRQQTLFYSMNLHPYQTVIITYFLLP